MIFNFVIIILIILTDEKNVTTYVIPYDLNFFQPIRSSQFYLLAFIYQIPIPFIMCFSTYFDSCMLLYCMGHVCGRSSVLSQCEIPQIITDRTDDKFMHDLKLIAKRYSRIIRYGFSLIFYLWYFVLYLRSPIVWYDLNGPINTFPLRSHSQFLTTLSHFRGHFCNEHSPASILSHRTLCAYRS